MLNRKQIKQDRKRLFEEYTENQRKKSRFEPKDNDQSVSSWDFVYYMKKYKSNE